MRKKLDIAEKLTKLSEENEELKVTKPPIQPRPLSIMDLVIPASAYELFSIEIAFDSREKEKVTQLLSLRENPEVKLKWTVFRDQDMKEFDWFKGEGLVQIRDDPPIYGREIDEGALVASHIGGYTFSMASYDLKTNDLEELFIFGLNNARKYDLKV